MLSFTVVSGFGYSKKIALCIRKYFPKITDSFSLIFFTFPQNLNMMSQWNMKNSFINNLLTIFIPTVHLIKILHVF